MTQIFDQESGVATPVTVIQAGPCTVLKLRTSDRDGYEAVQLGFIDKARPKKEKRSRPSQASRAERGQVADIKSKRSRQLSAKGVQPISKAGCEPKAFIREFRGVVDGFSIGQEIKVDCLDGVKAVDVVGTSKGRGYAGVMRRHNFSGQRASHGVKKVHRHAGSTGMSAFPSRVTKGLRMGGQYGNSRSTVRNLRVVRIDTENNLLLVEGAVPGPNGGMVMVKETNKV
ncbi:MAG TPA: 50S ribosomal protein L3 [Pirellulaceae bacterium]|nr:50S ribosomal protein L3 [Pirellulaceae bacterium]HMO92205.1 50S ribosomal protein L3 [Pirellulaceae bacterium]HMP68868.1 50S ribosomal protein L3 [Pirellulaceae bacterium]